MELELATTHDIAKELHRRRMKFVMVGRENSNHNKTNDTFIYGHAVSPEEILNMLEVGCNEITNLERSDPNISDDEYLSES